MIRCDLGGCVDCPDPCGGQRAPDDQDTKDKVEVSMLQQQLTLINDYDVMLLTPKQAGGYEAQSLTYSHLKKVHICPWGDESNNGPRPNDYLLHELLHACFAAMRDGRDMADGEYDREELLVQDICAIMVANSGEGN